jgi:hypothetical protein
METVRSSFLRKLKTLFESKQVNLLVPAVPLAQEVLLVLVGAAGLVGKVLLLPVAVLRNFLTGILQIKALAPAVLQNFLTGVPRLALVVPVLVVLALVVLALLGPVALTMGLAVLPAVLLGKVLGGA